MRELSTYVAQAAIYNACQSWLTVRGQEGEGRRDQLVEVFVTEVRRHRGSVSQRFGKGKACRMMGDPKTCHPEGNPHFCMKKQNFKDEEDNYVGPEGSCHQSACLPETSIKFARVILRVVQSQPKALLPQCRKLLL